MLRSSRVWFVASNPEAMNTKCQRPDADREAGVSGISTYRELLFAVKTCFR